MNSILKEVLEAVVGLGGLMLSVMGLAFLRNAVLARDTGSALIGAGYTLTGLIMVVSVVIISLKVGEKK